MDAVRITGLILVASLLAQLAPAGPPPPIDNSEYLSNVRELARHMI